MVKAFTNHELLEQLRNRLAGITQRKAADAIGVSEQFLSLVLHGKKRISPRIAEWLLEYKVEAISTTTTVFRKAS